MFFVWRGGKLYRLVPSLEESYPPSILLENVITNVFCIQRKEACLDANLPKNYFSLSKKSNTYMLLVKVNCLLIRESVEGCCCTFSSFSPCLTSITITGFLAKRDLGVLMEDIITLKTGGNMNIFKICFVSSFAPKYLSLSVWRDELAIIYTCLALPKSSLYNWVCHRWCVCGVKSERLFNFDKIWHKCNF